MEPNMILQTRILGRNTYIDGTLYLGWSGSCLAFDTDSPWIELEVCTDDPSVSGWPARLGIFVNGEPRLTRLLTEPSTTLHVDLHDADSRVRIMKLSEAAFGLLGVRHLRIAPGCGIHPIPFPSRRIEFIGDSITCGYGVEAKAGETFSTQTENPTKAYAMLAAEALQADAALVSWSGIGLLSAWVPETATEPNDLLLMSRLYPLHDLRLDERLGREIVLHNFRQDPVDLVVINLGTNDASWTRQKPEREQVFAQNYLAFLEQVTAARPGIPILCLCGLMEKTLCEIIHRQQEAFALSHPETRTGFLNFPLQQEADSYGADFHPSLVTQEKAARILENTIRSFMNW